MARTAWGPVAFIQETVTVDQWINVIAVFDPGDKFDPTAGVNIYRDGMRKVGAPTTGSRYRDFAVVPGNRDAPLRIGTRNLSQNSFFNGRIDEVMIFDRKLSDAEITELQRQTR